MAKKKETDPNFAAPIYIPGLDSDGLKTEFIDAETMGENVMKAIKRSPELEILIWLRDKFKQGCVMYATDVAAPILEPVRGDNGQEAWATGLTIHPRRGEKIENPQ